MDKSSVAPETERVRRIWERLAPRYDKDIKFFERVLFAGGREWVCSQAKGDVLEIAVGTGRNFAYYPPDVRLTGIDLSASMLNIARQRADQLGRQVDLRVGDAQALEFADETFDTVVLRAGGRLRLMEHVASPMRVVRAVQSLLNGIAVRTEGDHLVREPLAALKAFGFEVGQVERLKWGIVERVAARKAASE